HGAPFFLGLRDPDGAARVVLAIRGKLAREIGPEPPRVGGQLKLRFRVVHDDDVSHPRGGHAAAREARIQDEHGKSAPGERVGARGANDAGADDDDVRRRAPRHAGAIPPRKKSRGSKWSVASPVTNARPRMW